MIPCRSAPYLRRYWFSIVDSLKSSTGDSILHQGQLPLSDLVQGKTNEWRSSTISFLFCRKMDSSEALLLWYQGCVGGESTGRGAGRTDRPREIYQAFSSRSFWFFLAAGHCPSREAPTLESPVHQTFHLFSDSGLFYAHISVLFVSQVTRNVAAWHNPHLSSHSSAAEENVWCDWNHSSGSHKV